MTLSRKFPAIVGITLAAATVFSPLLAALTGAGVRGETFSLPSAGLLSSITTAVYAAIISLLIGVPFALRVEHSHQALKRTLWAAGLLVLMVPPYIVGEAWIVLLGPSGKVSRIVANLLGLGPHGTDPVAMARFTVPGFVYTRLAVGAVMGGCFFPIVALAVGSAYRRTDRRVFEAARLSQGRSGVIDVTARLLVVPALGAGLLVFAATLTEFAVPQLLRVRTIGEAIYERIQEGDLSTAAGLCLPLLPLVVGAGAIGAWMLMRSRSASLAGLEGEVPKFTGQTAGLCADVVATIVAIVAITSSLIIPATSLIWLTVAARLPPAPAYGAHKLLRASGFFPSIRGAWELAQDDAMRTVWLATLAATVAVVLSIVLVRGASGVGWGAWLGALGAGLAVPAPIVGLGLIALWNHDGSAFVYHSFLIVVLAWYARFLPVGVFLIQGALARVPRELESAAALAGRAPFARFAQVVLPNAMPGLAAAWLAMYVLCATEFGATLLVAPAGGAMLAPSIINLMRRGQDPEIAACQVLLLAIVALPLLPIGAVVAWRLRPRAPREGLP